MDYSVTFIALTGHDDAASRQESVASAGTVATMTLATTPSISKTFGQVSAHNPHPMHKAWSTVAFIVNPF
jgi:hypothetical protein